MSAPRSSFKQLPHAFDDNDLFGVGFRKGTDSLAFDLNVADQTRPMRLGF